MANRIQLRRDTSTNWAAVNPILTQGEVGLELDTGKLKIGNGIAAWSTLPYFTLSYSDLTGAPTIPTATSDLINDSGYITLADVPADVTDRLTSNGAEVVLTGGANPYTTFPAITGGDQLQIQGSEVLSVSGNLALTSTDGLNLITNGSGNVPGGSRNWAFNAQGDLELPAKFPIQFTAQFDAAHYAGGGTFQGDGTVSLGVQLQGLGAQFQWLVDDPTFTTDRGYVGQQAFRYTEADHGITGFNVDILIEMMGPDLGTGLYSLQVAFSPAPGAADLAKIRSTDELIISSGTKGWIFDVQGNVYLPTGGDIRDSTGTSVLGGGFSGNYNDLTNQPTIPEISKTQTAGSAVQTSSLNVTPNEISLTATLDPGFGPNENTIGKVSATAGQVNISSLDQDAPDVEYKSEINVYYPTGVTITNSPGPGAVQSWVFGNNGKLTLPNGAELWEDALISAANQDLFLGTKYNPQVSANCAIAAGDEFVADIEFNDDITVVQVGWTVNVGGTDYTVTAIDPAPPAFQYRITAAGAPFVQSEVYTFTNPVTVDKGWNIRQGTGTLVSSVGGAILSSESIDNGGGLTYRDFAVELPTPDGLNEQRWTFRNDGKLELPLGGDIVDSNNTSKFKDYANFDGDIIPDGDNTRSLGSPTRQWKEMYVANGSIYIGNIKLSNNAGTLEVTTVINPGEVNEAPEGDPFVGGGLSRITTPLIPGTTYKGLKASYGRVHSNGSANELNVSKIVIHKPGNTTTTIDPTSNNDNFRVSGLDSSDVVAMFVLYGDVNGPKDVAVLQTFTEAVIDNVILAGGVEDSFNTLADMRSAFYTNSAALTAAAGGLYTQFQFYENYVNATTGATTVREGSGATFDVSSVGGSYLAVPVTTGSNYLVGHKILILGSQLGLLGVDGVNDLIITVTGVTGNGEISTVSTSGLGAEDIFFGTFAGTNYQIGSGLLVAGVGKNQDTTLYANTNAQGSGYVVGDVLTLLGTEFPTGTSPANDITITINSVDVSGVPQNWTATGTYPDVWPYDSISDGGVDQYDTANFISTDITSNINYNNGQVVTDGVAFGPNGDYSFLYTTGIFGLVVTGNSANFVETTGNSGADGSSTTDTGDIYAADTPSETFDNAVKYLNIVNSKYVGAAVDFVHTDGGTEVDILIPDDGAGAGVGITRSSNQGIYNPYREGSWDSDISPGGIGWNIDGWSDLSNVTTREYVNLYAAFGFGGLGNKIVGTECVIYIPDNGKYYTVKFSQWTNNGNGGGFAYTRRELDLTSLQDGIRFSDGTRLTSAEGVGRVKLVSPGSRRIEEVHGYKSVTVTAATPGVTQNATIRQSSTSWDFYINADANLDTLYNTQNTYNYLEFSFDGGNSWVKVSFGGGQPGVYYQMIFVDNINRPVVADAVVSYRTVTGGTPVVWWDKADLPGGIANFRGAVIDYHSYTGDGTMIGTIHMVNDTGRDHITHTEVTSGSTNMENDDLWMTNENQLMYRRLDGAGRTLKIQWTAKVFYGSEFWD